MLQTMNLKVNIYFVDPFSPTKRSGRGRSLQPVFVQPVDPVVDPRGRGGPAPPPRPTGSALAVLLCAGRVLGRRLVLWQGTQDQSQAEDWRPRNGGAQQQFFKQPGLWLYVKSHNQIQIMARKYDKCRWTIYVKTFLIGHKTLCFRWKRKMRSVPAFAKWLKPSTTSRMLWPLPRLPPPSTTEAAIPPS